MLVTKLCQKLAYRSSLREIWNRFIQGQYLTASSMAALFFESCASKLSCKTLTIIFSIKCYYLGLFVKLLYFSSVGVVIKDVNNGAVDLGFDSLAGQIWRSVANGSPPLRCFSKLCSLVMGFAIRFALQRNTASVMKFWFIVFQSIYSGMHVVCIPYSLMKHNPAYWLQIITKHKGNISKSSNFDPLFVYVVFSKRFVKAY